MTQPAALTAEERSRRLATSMAIVYEFINEVRLFRKSVVDAVDQASPDGKWLFKNASARLPFPDKSTKTGTDRFIACDMGMIFAFPSEFIETDDDDSDEEGGDPDVDFDANKRSKVPIDESSQFLLFRICLYDKGEDPSFTPTITAARVSNLQYSVNNKKGLTVQTRFIGDRTDFYRMIRVLSPQFENSKTIEVKPNKRKELKASLDTLVSRQLTEFASETDVIEFVEQLIPDQ